MKKLLLVIGFLFCIEHSYAAGGGVSTATARRIVSFFSAPSNCVEGDKYYNLTSHSEFTCTSAGSWSATGVSTPISVTNGGTGQATYTKGDMLASPGGAVLNKLAIGTDGWALTADAASTNGMKWAAAAAGGLNTAMSNAASVALNTSLLPGTDTAITLGNQTHRFTQLWTATGTFARGIQFYDSTNSVANVIYWSALVGPRWSAGGFGSIQHHLEGLSGVDDVTWPDASGTIVLDSTLQTLSNKTITDLVTGGTTPAVSNTTANSCGTTAATIVGNNTTGVITVGAAAGTNCTITFTVAAPTRRQCTVTNETTANLSRSTFLTTTTSTVEGTFAAGDKISFVCAVY